MKRFNDDDDFQDEELFPEEINNDDDDGDGEQEAELVMQLNPEYIQVLEKRELVEVLRLQVAQKDLNYSILTKTMEYLEKSWFWRFKTEATKLRLISETYQAFKQMVDIEVLNGD